MKVYRVSKVRPDLHISTQHIADWREGKARFCMFGKCYVTKEDADTLYTTSYQEAQTRRLEFMQARLGRLKAEYDQAIQDTLRVREEGGFEEAQYFKWADDHIMTSARHMRTT